MKQSIRILIALVALAILSLAAWNFAFARSGLKPVGEMEMKRIELADANAQTGMDDPSSSNSSDDLSGASENEFYGTVEAIDGNIYTIDSQQIIINENTEVKDSIQVGDLVKVHAWTAADGSLIVREIELASTDDASSDDQSGDDDEFGDDDFDDDSDDDADDDSNDDSDDDHDDDDGDHDGDDDFNDDDYED
jgi:Domain of unknown function (DUF5666)